MRAPTTFLPTSSRGIRSAALLAVMALPLLIAGLYLTISGHGIVDRSEPAVAAETAAVPDATSATAADPLAKARSNLQRAGLPLSLLNGGMGQLSEGGVLLDNGANQLSHGLGQARAGSAQLADGLGQLNSGVGQLGDGARQISGGVDQVVDRLNTFGAMQGKVTTSLQNVINTLAVSPDPVSQTANGELRTLLNTLNTQGLGPDTLAQLQTLKEGARQLSYELNDPSARFVSGMSQAADGSRQLRDGLVQLDDGGKQLTDGTGQLVTGTGPIKNVVEGLSTSVNDATKALPKAGQTTAVAGQSSDNQVPPVSTGSGVPAWPYLIAALVALGAVVGAGLILAGRRMSGSRDWARGLIWTSATIGLAASIVLFVVSKVDSASTVDGIGTVLAGAALLFLSAAAFTATARTVELVCGPTVARVVNIVVLLAQLAVTGAVFAAATGNALLTHLAAFSPVSYVAAVLQQLGGGLTGTGWVAVGVLAATCAIALWITRGLERDRVVEVAVD